MAHVPHLLIPTPWVGPELPIESSARRHLDTVLRMRIGDTLSYTDGAGRVGEGSLTEAGVERGDEHDVASPTRCTHLLVSPPQNRHRQRFLVEKAAELGVASITWLEAQHGQGKPPRPDRAQAWADAALEQSRGAFRTQVAGEAVPVDRAPAGTWFASPAGRPVADIDRADPGDVWIAVGPEGGWAESELEGRATVSLADRILRVETAAVVAAALLQR